MPCGKQHSRLVQCITLPWGCRGMWGHVQLQGGLERGEHMWCKLLKRTPCLQQHDVQVPHRHLRAAGGELEGSPQKNKEVTEGSAASTCVCSLAVPGSGQLRRRCSTPQPAASARHNSSTVILSRLVQCCCISRHKLQCGSPSWQI